MADTPQIKGGLSTDPSKVNLYGAREEDVSEYQKSLEDSIKALQQRYAQPNWFNVAAGFLKPQLGGFAASLGSASEALGQNVERERESQLPIAQMRTQLAMSKIAMGQNRTAADLAEQALNRPGGLTAEDVARVSNYDKERGAILQAQFDNQTKTREQIMKQHQEGRTDAELLTEHGNDFLKLFPNGTANLPTIPGAVSMSVSGKSQTTSLDTPPIESGLTQEQWKNMPLQQKNVVMKSIAGTNQENIANAENALRAPVESATNDIARLRSMRELATAPGMESVFNVLGGSDLMSLIGKGLSEGRLTEKLSDLEELLTQAKITDPITRRKASELVKLINEQKLSSGNAASATDEFRRMKSSSNPSLANPQDAFVNLTDAIAHGQRRHIDLWQMQQGNNPQKTRLNAYTFIGSPMWEEYNKKYADEHAHILGQPMRLDTPSSIYDMSPQTTSAEVRMPSAASPASPASPAAAPSGSVRPPEAPSPARLGKNAIQAEIERRAALKKP